MDKDYILREIRRTAEEDGGVPLGRQRFLRETGIREDDWSGKYWARWGDAVREAGFEPNQLQTALDEIELVERYIALSLKLGALPTHAELQMERRFDPSFPSHNTFARFGSKASLVSKVREYCLDRQGYEDIVSLCDSYEARPHTPDTSPATATKIEDGSVYLIKSGRFYKIGRTNSTGRRERELALQLPERAATIHVIRTDDPVGIEAYWHRRFADKRRKANGSTSAPSMWLLSSGARSCNTSLRCRRPIRDGSPVPG